MRWRVLRFPRAEGIYELQCVPDDRTFFWAPPWTRLLGGARRGEDGGTVRADSALGALGEALRLGLHKD